MTKNRLLTAGNFIGKAVAHDSADAHVTGQARFVDDMEPTTDLLHVAIGMSEVASGRLTLVDLSEVERSPGVVDVLQYSDLRFAKDIAPVFDGDLLLANETITHYGQPVFAVAATSQRLARQAVRRAHLEYDRSVVALDLQQAIEKQDYVRPPHRMQRGDAGTALRNAAYRVSGCQWVGGQEHFYLETQAARARPEENGAVTVWSSNQNPTEAQHLIAEVLGVAMHKVTVIVRRMGGGFGGKETQAASCAVFAALFAVRTGRQVSCRLARRDDMIMTGKRHAFRNRYDVGFDSTGRIEGIEFELAAQCGHSADLSDAIVDRAMFHCDNAYFLPQVTIDGLRCRTNTVSNTAFRGFGGPQGMMAIETVIDEIAYSLNKDPLDIRLRNLYGQDTRNVTPYGQTVESFTVPHLLEELERSADYRKRRAQTREFNTSDSAGHFRRGIAITPVKFGISFTVKHLNQAGALLQLYSDGSLQLNHAGTEMGQGLLIKVRQIVAQELGMSLDRIEVMATRTDKVPNSSATAASSGTDLNGMAALLAAKKLKRRLLKYLMKRHGIEQSGISFSGDCIALSDGKASTAAYTWPELASAAYKARISLSATGFYRTPKIHYDRSKASGQPFYYFANGAAVSEVRIDTLTGETEIVRVDILHDAGRSINPAIDIGQIEGGFVQGAGWLTHEQLCWDENGRLLTDSAATYKIPAIGDMPKRFNVSLLEDSPNTAATVFHSKAVGEPPLMLAISVFAAIRDAVGSLADYQVFPILEAPATPEEVLKACMRVTRAETELSGT